MNGYFRLSIGENGVAVKLFPPTDGGAALDANEVSQYLERQSIPCDIKAINAGIQSCSETTVPVSSRKMYPIGEKCTINISDDKMSATARFYPPSNGGEDMDKAEIVAELRFQGILHGIQENIVDDYIANRRYCTDYEIALGTPMQYGTDAYIEYFFNADNKARPTVKEDGSVDFFNLNILNNVHEGDLLAKLHPEKKGEMGRMVTGDPIMPPPVKREIIRYERNSVISEDKTELTSAVNGHVSLVDGRVFVSNVYEVENVDNATGNIDYDGSVKINGNVNANFSVRARGGVEVVGVVEGAFIEAGGNIIIGRGMNGMEKGEIHAEGNIIAKFLENAKAVAGGYVESESIIHSEVIAGTEIHVHGRRGFITGGRVSAQNMIEAKVFGSAMGAVTNVEVGLDPNLKVKSQQLKEDIKQHTQNLKKIDPVVKAAAMKLKLGGSFEPDQLTYMKQLSDQSRQMHNAIDADMYMLEELESLLETGADASIVVTDIMYPGTILTISEASMNVKQQYQYCKFKKIRGDVKMEAL